MFQPVSASTTCCTLPLWSAMPIVLSSCSRPPLPAQPPLLRPWLPSISPRSSPPRRPPPPPPSPHFHTQLALPPPPPLPLFPSLRPRGGSSPTSTPPIAPTPPN